MYGGKGANPGAERGGARGASFSFKTYLFLLKGTK